MIVRLIVNKILVYGRLNWAEFLTQLWSITVMLKPQCQLSPLHNNQFTWFIFKVVHQAHKIQKWIFWVPIYNKHYPYWLWAGWFFYCFLWDLKRHNFFCLQVAAGFPHSLNSRVFPNVPQGPVCFCFDHKAPENSARWMTCCKLSLMCVKDPPWTYNDYKYMEHK